jgi:protoporphyrinogen oxidase
MALFPQTLAKNAGTIFLNDEITQLSQNQVLLKSGKTVDFNFIVFANGQQHEKMEDNQYFGTSTFYFAGMDQESIPSSLLLQGNENSRILHFCFPSKIQPNYAPKGKALCSVTLNWAGNIQNPAQVADEILIELSEVFPSVNWSTFSFLKHFDIPKALPKWESGNKETWKVNENQVFIGDYLAYPSINGALRSGREAGEWISNQLKNQNFISG